MRDYTNPRNFKLANNVNLEIAYLPWGHHWLATITKENHTGSGPPWPLPDIWIGRSAKSPVMAIKAARLNWRVETDPEFRKVYSRLKPPFGESIIETLRKNKEKILMTDGDKPPKKIYMNSRSARSLKIQLEMYRDGAKAAGLNMPIIIEDDSLPDGKAIKE